MKHIGLQFCYSHNKTNMYCWFRATLRSIAFGFHISPSASGDMWKLRGNRSRHRPLYTAVRVCAVTHCDLKVNSNDTDSLTCLQPSLLLFASCNAVQRQFIESWNVMKKSRYLLMTFQWHRSWTKS